MTEKKQNRVVWLDIARSFAIIMVVLCHAAESVCQMNIEMWDSLSIGYRLYRITGFTLGRLGVPFFLFLSGYLVLNKKIETEQDIKDFYRHKFVPLLLSVEIWNVFYFLFEIFFWNKDVNLIYFGKQLLFLQKSGLSHMWYMPMILGLYLAVPFLSMLVRKVSFKVAWIPMLAVVLNTVLLPSLTVFIRLFQPDFGGMSTIMDLGFLGTVYGVYLLLGFYLYRKPLMEKWNGILLAILSVVLLVFTIGVQYVSYQRGIGYNVWYNFIPLFMCAILLFELFRRMETVSWKDGFVKFCNFISQISLGIYFLHKPIQFMLMRLEFVQDMNRVGLSVSIFIVSLFISCLICWLLSKGKVLRKYLLLMN